MSSCHRVDSLLSAYLEEEAGPAEVRFVEGHLTVCSRCRIQVDEVTRVISRVRALPRVLAAPSFTEQVLARSHGLPAAGLEEPLVPEPSRGALRWAVPLAAAAALAVAFLSVRFAAPPSGIERPVVENPAGPGGPGLVAERLPEASAADPASPAPVIWTLTGDHPGLEGLETSLGMASDAYVMDTWTARQPAGGGSPVLTRVSGRTDARVVVRF